MKISLILVACLAYAAADYVLKKGPVKYADEQFLVKQKFVLDMLQNIHEPLQKVEYLKEEVKYVEGESFYKLYPPILEFIKLYENGMLPTGQVFSVLNEVHMKESIALFDLFYYSKDWTTFSKNVIWARMHMNEAMFTYTLTLAVAHMEEFVGIVLPAPYEISPYLYYTGDVMSEATSYMMQGLYTKMDKYIILANYTSEYYLMNDEGKLAYLTEDIGWNSMYYYNHIDYPFWMGGNEFKLNKDRRGELYLFMYRQLLARYYMERLANGLGEIPELSFMTPIKTGYNPMIRSYSGIGFTYRKNYYEVSTTEEYHMLNMIDDYERRIRDVIDYGYYVKKDGTKINMRKPESIEYLGNMIQSNPDSVCNEFFGDMMTFARMILSGTNYEHMDDHKIIPSALVHFQTTMRDPVMYQLIKRMMKLYFQFIDYLPSYKHEELIFDGVKIENMKVGKLVTFFENFDSDITTAVDMNVMMRGGDLNKKMKYYKQDYLILARQMRLNHKPFTVTIDVTSDKAQKVVARLYMGPKYDEFGNVITINENRENFLEIDQFVYELPSGKHTIKRDSVDFYFTVKDRTTYSEIYKMVMLSIEGSAKFPLDMSEAHCGFPDRLLLPKGHTEGMPMQFFVILTPYVETGVKQFSTFDQTMSCGVGSGSRFIDNRPFGYPFDRIIDETEFFTPNMFFADVAIYHKTDKIDPIKMMSN